MAHKLLLSQHLPKCTQLQSISNDSQGVAEGQLYGNILTLNSFTLFQFLLHPTHITIFAAAKQSYKSQCLQHMCNLIAHNSQLSLHMLRASNPDAV